MVIECFTCIKFAGCSGSRGNPLRTDHNFERSKRVQASVQNYGRSSSKTLFSLTL